MYAAARPGHRPAQLLVQLDEGAALAAHRALSALHPRRALHADHVATSRERRVDVVAEADLALRSAHMGGAGGQG